MTTPKRTRAVAAKLSELRGLSHLESFDPATDNSLAVVAFMHIHHTSDLLIKAAERDLAAYGLTIARYAILRMLARREPMPLSWLADKHYSRRSNITAMVERLVRDGLLERFPDETDRRIVRVGLTPEGVKIVVKARKPHFRFIEKTMAPLGPDELRRLIAALDRLSSAVDGTAGRPQSHIGGT
jgi:DNA-binding MarR family transcriptional regulator